MQEITNAMGQKVRWAPYATSVAGLVLFFVVVMYWGHEYGFDTVMTHGRRFNWLGPASIIVTSFWAGFAVRLFRR